MTPDEIYTKLDEIGKDITELLQVLRQDEKQGMITWYNNNTAYHYLVNSKAHINCAKAQYAEFRKTTAV